MLKSRGQGDIIKAKEVLVMEIKRIGNLDCVFSYPQNFEENKKYPLIISLHGAGNREHGVESLKNDGYFVHTSNFKEFPFVSVMPYCPENSWFDLFQDLKNTVLKIVNLPFVDAKKVYVLGISMGGYAAWQLGMSMPEYFAAMVPICGGGMYWNAGRLVNVPVWAFHGGKDPVVFAEESIKMVNAINNSGGNAKVTVYPENGHDSWTDTLTNWEVFEWLLKQENKNTIKYIDKYNDPKIYG